MAAIDRLADAAANSSDSQSLTAHAERGDNDHPQTSTLASRRSLLKLHQEDFDTSGQNDEVVITAAKFNSPHFFTFPRLVAAEHRKSFEGELVQSGSVELDALLGGGLERGTSTLLIGGAGVGKSSIAVTFAAAAASRGERVAMFAFDEGVGTLFARASGLGVPLRNYVERGLITLQQIDPAEMSPGEFTHLVRDSVEKKVARVLVIDSLNGSQRMQMSGSLFFKCTS